MALSTINNSSMADTAVHGVRNLIINGAMQVAQRGTSSTSAGIQTVDRFKTNFSGPSIIQTQETLSSGEPYDRGFRKFYRMQVTTASSSTAAYVECASSFEGQDIAQSGWQYTSSNSSITVSFWARSSLAGTYYIVYQTRDGTEYHRNYAFTLAANTWTKVTFTTTGNSNLQIDSDTGRGLDLYIIPAYGTDYTGGEEVSLTDWYTRNGQTDAYLPNFTENWANTLNATFDITGVQLEVGSTATPFEHRSYGDELARCQRYYEKTYPYANTPGTASSYNTITALGMAGMDEETSGQRYMTYPWRVEKRASPTLTIYDQAGNSGKVTTLDNAGTQTHNVGVALAFAGTYVMGAGPSNSAIWGLTFFCVGDSEL